MATCAMAEPGGSGGAAGCRASELLDASASLVPWTPRLGRLPLGAIRDYPDRSHAALRLAIADCHGLDPDLVLPGNGAAELFTWVARDAAAAGVNLLPAPGFADYGRALRCWNADFREQSLPLHWSATFPHCFPSPADAAVLWVCNPHNPTGQLWSRASLEPLLQRFSLVICDEAFLPLVPDGERQSLIPLLADHDNLWWSEVSPSCSGSLGSVSGTSSPACCCSAGRAAIHGPQRCGGGCRGEAVVGSGKIPLVRKVQRWTAREGAWMQKQLSDLDGVTALPSAANFLLLHGDHSLGRMRLELEQRHRILLRDCGSFRGLGERWLRIGLQTRRRNRRIVEALRQVQSTRLPSTSTKR